MEFIDAVDQAFGIRPQTQAARRFLRREANTVPPDDHERMEARKWFDQGFDDFKLAAYRHFQRAEAREDARALSDIEAKEQAVKAAHDRFAAYSDTDYDALVRFWRRDMDVQLARRPKGGSAGTHLQTHIQSKEYRAGTEELLLEGVYPTGHLVLVARPDAMRTIAKKFDLDETLAWLFGEWEARCYYVGNWVCQPFLGPNVRALIGSLPPYTDHTRGRVPVTGITWVRAPGQALQPDMEHLASLPDSLRRVLSAAKDTPEGHQLIESFLLN